MDIPGAARPIDPEAWDKAQARQERLLEDLKKQVKTELRDIGVLRKELRVTVPAGIIADYLDMNYDELMQDAFVPGFRKGRAPRRLVEKRYGAEVRESLTSSIVSQSYFAAIDNAKLDVLGEPLFAVTIDGGTKLVQVDEALQHLKLPETGDFSYTCEIEIKPRFELPELKGIEITDPAIEITEEMVTEEIDRQRKQRGRLEPVLDEPARKGDYVVADVALVVAGETVKQEDNLTVAVRPASIEGIPLVELDKTLMGVRPGQTCTASCTIPPDFERPELRGQPGEFRFTVHEVKRLVLLPMEDFLAATGYESEAEARRDYRERMESQRDQFARAAKRAQIEEYLLKNTKLDLPEQFSTRQTERAVLRRAVELHAQGVAMEDIEAQLDELRTSARQQVANELKLSFILEKVAEKLDIDVTDEELNSEIAEIARRYRRRFDRVRDDLQRRGLLEELVERIRQQKCLDALLADARLVPADGRRIVRPSAPEPVSEAD